VTLLHPITVFEKHEGHIGQGRHHGPDGIACRYDSDKRYPARQMVWRKKIPHFPKVELSGDKANGKESSAGQGIAESVPYQIEGLIDLIDETRPTPYAVVAGSIRHFARIIPWGEVQSTAINAISRNPNYFPCSSFTEAVIGCLSRRNLTSNAWITEAAEKGREGAETSGHRRTHISGPAV